MYYVEIKSSKENCRFYTEDIHGKEKCETIIANGGIKINEDLHQYLLTLGSCRFIDKVEDREYTIEDKNLFEEVQIKSVDDGLPTMPDTIKSLGEQLTKEKLKNIQKDSTIAQLGQELAKVKLEVISMRGGN